MTSHFPIHQICIPVKWLYGILVGRTSLGLKYVLGRCHMYNIEAYSQMGDQYPLARYLCANYLPSKCELVPGGIFLVPAMHLMAQLVFPCQYPYEHFPTPPGRCRPIWEPADPPCYKMRPTLILCNFSYGTKVLKAIHWHPFVKTHRPA